MDTLSDSEMADRVDALAAAVESRYGGLRAEMNTGGSLSILDVCHMLAERLRVVAPSIPQAAGSARDGLEQAAKWVDRRLKDYVDEHGSYDPETGATEFPGNGDEYCAELDEIAEGIRALVPAVLAVPAPERQVAVKGLEWTLIHDETGMLIWCASKPFGSSYHVEGRDMDQWEWMGTVYDHIDAAKDAAQTDYEQRILSALTHPLASPETTTHRHKKRGTEYVLIGIGKMQAEDWYLPIDDDEGIPVSHATVNMREVAIYRSATDPTEIWVRPREEFEDGRFEALQAAQPVDGETK